jgi:hypothetical protein
MKNFFTLNVALFLLVITCFAQIEIADCPMMFDIKRNNGGSLPQGPGTCSGDAQIKIYFTDCPAVLPRLDSLYYEGKKIAGLTFSATDGSNCTKNNAYLSICVYGNNIPAAKKLTFYFTYTFPTGQVPKECEVPEGGPLPINLNSFSVGRTGSAVALNWKTEAEISAMNFEVQRSYDNMSFKTIATVAATVNGSSTKSYSYVDNSNTSNATSFYRLKIVKQSETSYSDIKTVKGISAKAAFTIFPNPAVSNSKITITDISEPTRVQLLDNSGRLVKTLMLNNTNTVELSGLQKGAYMIRLIGSVSGTTEIRKLTVIN